MYQTLSSYDIQKDVFHRLLLFFSWLFRKDWIESINFILQPWDKVFLCKLGFDINS